MKYAGANNIARIRIHFKCLKTTVGLTGHIPNTDEENKLKKQPK